MPVMSSDSTYSADLVMTRDEVRAFDAFAINELLIPGVVLMENAGRSCAELIKRKLADADAPKVCIFCGTGNNGGDGYVIARHLLNRDFEVVVVVCGDYDRIKGDARINLGILERMGQSIERLNLADPDLRERVATFTSGADLIVDALLGTGLRGQVSEQCLRLIESINDRHIPVFAVDIPSGLDCDTGKPLGASIVAEQTVTFVAIKRGFVASEDAGRYTGQVTVASIGVEPNIRTG
jgi:NAD(P)H-hydrate epimerase